MSEIFFGLRRPPFPTAADPASLFEPSGQRAARRAIDGLVDRCVGVILLEADAGAGKSELLRCYQRQVVQERVLALLFTRADFDFEILAKALADALFGPFKPIPDPSQLDARLLERRRAGQATVLLIDNAERLSAAAWLALAKLVTLGVPNEPPITLVLAGRPPLSSLLAAPARPAFKIRSTARINLPNWSTEEANEFVRRSLVRAGAQNPEHILDSAAVRAIVIAARGIPGRLRSACNAALEAGAARREKPVSLETVDRAIQQSADRPPVAPLRSWGRGAGIAAAVSIAIGLGWWALERVPSDLPTPAPIASANAALPTTPAPPPVAATYASGSVDPATAQEPADDDSVDVFLLPARRGDTLRELYRIAYRDLGTRPSFDRFLAANPGVSPDHHLTPDALVAFPGPLGPRWRGEATP
jgi:type II secretory pathway predicted ATPase ExeA